MIEIRIHGRGGQGGVTLAKLISTMRYLQGMSVQAFGLYAAERSGAPLQAFCRYDTSPITNRNLIYEPDHIVILDPSLVDLGVTKGLKEGGWILINTNEDPEFFAKKFEGYHVAVIDATSLAKKHKLGTTSLPIVNTALLGAVAKLFDVPFEDVYKTLEHAGFLGGNVDAAKEAYENVIITEIRGKAKVEKIVVPKTRTPGLARKRVTEFPILRTGDWATQNPHRQQFLPPCNYYCPAGNDVQAFLKALTNEDVDEALAILLETTPFPSTCGRVCPAPCMTHCNRVEFDGSVNIRDLERYAGDHGNVSISPKTSRKEAIAVIGSGPAGLSAAYHLARLGYKVTVYEKEAELGGLLRTGIPKYRLPREQLDRDIQRILDLGVVAKTNTEINKEKLEELAKEFDYVLVSTGLQNQRGLSLGLDDPNVVMQGLDFLHKVSQDEIRVDGEEIVVVGGGNTAIDASRTSMRLGAKKVRIIYRRTRKEMPAIEEEIEHGLEEGLQIDYLTAPVSIKPNESGKGYLLTCRKMELGEPDESGRRRPIPIEGSEFDIPCDRVLLALGQSPEYSILPEGEKEAVETGYKDEQLGATFFAAGDVAVNEGTVTAAIGSGRRAAHHIHQQLTGEDLHIRHDKDQVIGIEDMKLHLFDRVPRHDGETLPPEERVTSFEEVHKGLSELAEAKRCMSCGVCNECDLCITYCPEGVITRIGRDFRFDYDYCKGCGLCAAECPRNVIFMSSI